MAFITFFYLFLKYRANIGTRRSGDSDQGKISRQRLSEITNRNPLHSCRTSPPPPSGRWRGTACGYFLANRHNKPCSRSDGANLTRTLLEPYSNLHRTYIEPTTLYRKSFLRDLSEVNPQKSRNTSNTRELSRTCLRIIKSSLSLH